MPFIRVARGWKACDTQQQLKVLQQLPELFKKHEVTSVLTDIIFDGICNPKFYDKIPAALLVDINTSLPSDDNLHLKDSIYHSRLVQEPNENEVATNHKKKKLPLTLLRIPSDLQCHLFQFLDYEELTRVQKVCRALCIAARNPSSIYSMDFEQDFYPQSRNFFTEWLSRPRSLAISIYGNAPLIIGNSKWGRQVIDLSIDSYAVIDRKANTSVLRNLGHFENLTKCEIRSFPDILLNGQIASYSTLKKLSLEGRDWTENVVDEIRKFKNLEHLSLQSRHTYHENENSIHLNPISFAKLREVSMKFSGKLPHVFYRILIGSHPESVTVKVPWMYEECRLFPQTDAAVEAIRAVNHLTIDVRSMDFINALHPLLQRAQRKERPFLEQCRLTFRIQGNHQILLPPIITLFQCAKQSKLTLNFWDIYLSPKYDFEPFVQDICNAPYGTFNEIAVKIDVGILTSKMNGVDWCQGILTVIETEERSKADRQSVRSLVMKYIDKFEEWMRAWLWFDVERMEQIGLRKLRFEFKCNLDQDNEHWVVIEEQDWNDEVEAKMKRVDAVLDIMADEWIQQRAERWGDIDNRCVVKVDIENQEYTVTLSLQS